MKSKSFILKSSCMLLAFSWLGCTDTKNDSNQFITENVNHAVEQYTLQTDIIEKSGKILNPRTIRKDGSVQYISMEDWVSGFFPGSMWYMYELTNDVKWDVLAQKYTEALEPVKHLKWHHDVGFMIGCSFLNGYFATGKEAYKEVVVTAAHSLATRYRPGVKAIQSWNVDRGWQSERGWECPVIIDNMMNLELLFEAARFSGDSTLRQVAIDHANTTLEHQFRADNSCYHVIDYNLLDGTVRHKHTAQGYAHESAWARGEAWAIYGYTAAYRYTGDKRYLDQAEKIYHFIFNHKNLPTDLIPYWDFNAPNIPNEPRDASAAAITASALYEMHTYLPNTSYKETADKILESLSSPAYRAEIGTNGNFLLMHSVGSIPHKQEIDVPLNYADYYYLEALLRKQRLEANEPIR
ncbi:MAG: glycoside hydrolase family 88 protein [Phocaeicola sp.]